MVKDCIDGRGAPNHRAHARAHSRLDRRGRRGETEKCGSDRSGRDVNADGRARRRVGAGRNDRRVACAKCVGRDDNDNDNDNDEDGSDGEDDCAATYQFKVFW